MPWLHGLESLFAVAAALAACLLLVWAWRSRRASWPDRMAALTALTLFLTFDLVVFGAFTRLTDSGLGCPDWPGCYGASSPLGAKADIHAAQAALPDGPVTWAKAWIEMVHRYLAMTVGGLIVVTLVLAWRHRHRLAPRSVAWATTTLVWVLVQGLFGKYTVTWKLYPAIVTLHLLGGVGLLALLAWQLARARAWRPQAAGVGRPVVFAVLAVVLVQVALGGWVSTNYAVLACQGFPSCNGAWWPSMDGSGFAVARELGRRADGGWLPVEALIGIHWAHRLFAVVALGVWGALAWRLAGSTEAGTRRAGRWLLALAGLQLASGLSNVVLGWPIAGALLHSGGAAAAVGWLSALAACWPAGAGRRVPAVAAGRGRAAPMAQEMLR